MQNSLEPTRPMHRRRCLLFLEAASTSPPATLCWSHHVVTPKEASAGIVKKEKKQGYCSRCGASDTPEWRSGPLGPHTLCNKYVCMRRKR